MAIEIVLPGTAASASEATIAEWRAGEGEAVSEGQPLFVIAGVADPIQAPATGTLRILARTGVSHEVGTLLGYIEQP